jgi:type IV pilus assembly protein PilN
MIRINFLPVKEKRKEEEIRLWLILSGLVIVVEVIVLSLVYFHYRGKIKELINKENIINKEIADLQKKIKDVQDFENKKKEVEQKLNVIEALAQGRDLDVILLDELAKSVPYNPESRIKKRIQLKSFSKKGSLITIKGISMDQESIALFIGNLEKSDYYKSVILRGVTAKKEKGISYFEFDLNATVEEPQKTKTGG